MIPLYLSSASGPAESIKRKWPRWIFARLETRHASLISAQKNNFRYSAVLRFTYLHTHRIFYI